MQKPEENERKESRSWIDYVTEQSWEPELLISGLAIYATLQMPDLLRAMYRYYQYNLQSGSGILDEALPLLIYSVFTAVAYMLTVAFITHFVIRAFWVGFIGLMSVYRDGIRFDNLPYSDLYKEEARKNLGTAQQMVMKLDNISSLIFSVAFSLVLIMVAVGLIYLVFFLLYNVLKLFLGPEIFNTYARVLYWVMMTAAISYVGAVFILNMKRYRNNPRMARWHFNLSWKLNAVIMPLVYKPVQFISLTFLSNMSTRRFAAYYGVLFFAFFITMMVVMLRSGDVTLFDARNYDAARSAFRTVDPHNYSEHIDGDALLMDAAIDRALVSSSVLPVFIPYPKLLDEKLNLFCKKAAVPDSLPRFQQRRLVNQQHIACADRFFSFVVDDTVGLDAELYFAGHPRTGQEGFRAFLDIGGLQRGRHMLRINRPPVDRADSARISEKRPLTFEDIIPFWVVEE